MVGSAGVTDAGIDHLSRGESRRRRLRSVDLSFCRRTTYAGTFVLRDRLIALEVIRRQPLWLDGTFVTPFRGAPGAGEEEAEKHVYWADGTFSFSRGVQSSGFVCDLFPAGDRGGRKGEDDGDDNPHSHLGDRLQYTDFDPPRGWPAWSRYCYRPGVSLLRLENEAIPKVDGKGQTEIVRSVLVAQRLEGIRAPSDAPCPYHASRVPLGESRTLNRDGDVLDDDEGGGGGSGIRTDTPSLAGCGSFPFRIGVVLCPQT